MLEDRTPNFELQENKSGTLVAPNVVGGPVTEQQQQAADDDEKKKATPVDAQDEDGPVVQYLEAENLDFSRQQGCDASKGKVSPPAIPPKPAHLRRSAGATSAATSTGTNPPVSASPRLHPIASSSREALTAESATEHIEYKELDPRETQALFLITKQVIGENL